MSIAERAYLEEFVRRFSALELASAALDVSRTALLDSRFPKQRALVEGKERRRAGFCPRRTGKTEGNVGLILDGCLSGPEHLVIFVAVTRQRAYDLTWRAVEKACVEYGIDSKTNESRYERTFSNGSIARWVGADDLSALRTKRGDKLWRVVIDEAQDFDLAILRELVTDIFGPSLEDMGGDMVLTGTPGKVCAGYWYSITGEDSDPLKRQSGWTVYSWGAFDNPHIPRIHERLRSGEIAAELGGEDSPTYRREWLGKWVRDTGALFYRFDASKNLHDRPQDQLVGSGWGHALGWDLGLRDSMAMVVWAFHANDSTLYEAESWSKPGALIDECAARIEGYHQRYNFVGCVADTGGGGAMFVAELEKRHGLHFDAAKKTEKAEHVRMFSDELRAGRIKLKRGSPYHQEIAVLPKVLEWDEEKTGKPAPEDPRFSNHCSDSGLYSWRWAMQYLAEPAASKPRYGSEQWLDAEAQRMLDTREERQSQAPREEDPLSWL